MAMQVFKANAANEGGSGGATAATSDGKQMAHAKVCTDPGGGAGGGGRSPARRRGQRRALNEAVPRHEGAGEKLLLYIYVKWGLESN